ncbi:MAG: DUF21 domain-containing protein, partial [Flavobacterium sp.]|nr:DUF21 domain-containing protein [Flavobacterium sp.]
MDSDPSSILQSIDFELLANLVIVIVLLICSAFISGTEVALFSLSQKNIDDLTNDDYSKGTMIAKLLERPKKLLATILVANNFINIAIVIVFASSSDQLFRGIETPWVLFLLDVIVVTFLI